MFDLQLGEHTIPDLDARQVIMTLRALLAGYCVRATTGYSYSFIEVRRNSARGSQVCRIQLLVGLDQLNLTADDEAINNVKHDKGLLRLSRWLRTHQLTDGAQANPATHA